MLVTACKDGHVEIVRVLLEHFADIEAADLVRLSFRMTFFLFKKQSDSACTGIKL